MTFAEVVLCIFLLIAAGLIGFIGAYLEKVFMNERRTK